MHREIDAPVEQRLLDLLCKQAFAALFRQRPILNGIAAGANDDELDLVLVACPCAAASRERTARACTKASGLPRVPMRKEAVDCAI